MSQQRFKQALILLSLAMLLVISSMLPSPSRSYNAAATGSTMMVYVLIIGSYFFPSLCAFMRGHHQIVPIFLTNLFFGWTGLGWIGTLIWSASAITYKRL